MRVLPIVTIGDPGAYSRDAVVEWWFNLLHSFRWEEPAQVVRAEAERLTDLGLRPHGLAA